MKIKNIIKAHDRLYIVARCIKNRNDSKLARIIRAYYGDSNESFFFIEHNGEKYPEKIIYYIRFGEALNKINPIRSTGGLCSILRQTLLNLNFSDYLGIVPVIEWKSSLPYYDSGMDSNTMNVFEYYFKPVSSIDSKDIDNCRNIIYGRQIDSFVFLQRASDMGTSYKVKVDEIERLGYLYKKYIRLNQMTQTFIDESIQRNMVNGKLLGVHVRGTDFNMGFGKHPVVVTVQEYLAKAKEVYCKGGYDKIFLATDDANALELFQQEFQENLLYYKDVIRSKNHIGVQTTRSERPLHYYKLGLEVLRDVYTLASCDSLICGLSNVSFVARSINLALDRKYTEIVIIEHGVHATDESEAKAYRRERKKKKKLMGG